MGRAEPLEIGELPDLVRIAEEVRESGEPRVLRREGEAIAVLMPLGIGLDHGPGRVKTEADRKAFLRSAGGWKGVDVDHFLRDNYESRQLSTRPPVEF